MTGRNALGGAAALVAALAVSGCAALFGGYDLAPNGLTRDDDALRRALASEAPKAYRSVIEGGRALPDDDLLRLLYAGMAGRHAGAWDESSRLLDVASYLAEDRVTMSVSRELLGLVTSDHALAYTPGPTERLMIPYTAALNYLDLGDREAAAVEARRIEALLDQLDGRGPAFLHYFAGAVFRAAGDDDAADVAVRRGDRAAESSSHRAQREDGGAPDAGDTGEVVVLVEHGFVPHRVEQSVVIVLPPEQLRMLTDGSAGERTVAAAEAAARVLLSAAVVYGDRSGYYRDAGFRSAVHLEPWRDDRCKDGEWTSGAGGCAEASSSSNGNPYLLRISWPVLFHDPAGPATVRVRADTVLAGTVARFDIAAGVRRDFDDDRAAILARTVARAAAKVALSSGVEKGLGKRDETAGQIAGLLTNLTTLLTERADTRSWHLLPGSVSMLRLRLPPGTHDLSLELAPGRSLELGPVSVERGGTAVVSTRIWR